MESENIFVDELSKEHIWRYINHVIRVSKQ